MSDEHEPICFFPREGTVFGRQTLDDDHCFLCGTELADVNRTDEHIIPRWLQRRFVLWDEQLNLPNGTGIPYRQLLVPCCHNCNTGVLSQLESEIEAAMAGGYREVRKVPQERLFQWCSKIFYGIMYRDTQLLFDRRSGGPETILERESLYSLFTLHLFLQSLYVPFEFVGFVPHSMFVVETDKADNSTVDFDFHHYSAAITREQGPKPTLVLAMRCADVGIICVFLDNGLQKELCQQTYDEFEGIPLIPLQFNEFICHAMCKEYSRNYPSRYNSWTNSRRLAGCRVELEPSPIAGPMYGEFHAGLYLDLLLLLCGRYMAPTLREELEQINANDHIVVTPTFLWDAQNRPLRANSDGWLRPALILPPEYRERENARHAPI